MLRRLFVSTMPWMLVACGPEQQNDRPRCELLTTARDAARPGTDEVSSGGAAEPSGGSAGEAGANTGEVRQPHNVIFVIGDGMQLACEVAASRYLTGEDFGLSFHDFPARGYVTTWDVTGYDALAAARGLPPYQPSSFDPYLGYDPAEGGWVPYPLLPDTAERAAYFASMPVPNSASTATALATGHKTDTSNIAWAAGDPPDGALVTSPELLRQRYGMAIGFVTTGPLPGATPAGFFAHTTNRNSYLEITDGMLETLRPEVMIGGGALSESLYFDPNTLARLRDSDEYLCVTRQPGMDGGALLLAGALEARQSQRKLFGLFGDASGSFGTYGVTDSPGAPSVIDSSLEDPELRDGVVAGLEVLAQDPDGFFFLVEQADIDLANHANDFIRMLGYMADLEDTVRAIVQFVERPHDAVDWSNTTVIVTTDHATGYLRLPEALSLGELPAAGSGAVTYGTGGHTAELAQVYVKGEGESLLEEYMSVYPTLSILDNTALFEVTLRAAAGSSD